MQQEQFLLPEGVTVRDSQQNRYTIEGVLGQGQNGAVYRVRDRDHEHEVYALKEIIDPDQDDRKRFAFECEVLTRVHHPALPAVHQVFENDKLKRVYLLMDYVAGKNLALFVREKPDKRLTLSEATRFIVPVVNALVYMHTQPKPIVHRDVKPANIIVPTEGKNTVLVDFGSAKEYVPGMATKAISHHSHGYAAPEQYSTGTTPATDIYGLGATLYTLLTGLVPIDASSRILKLMNTDVDPLKPVHTLVDAIPLTVSDAIQKAMALKISDRFETIGQFWQVFQSDRTLVLPQTASIHFPETPLPQSEPHNAQEDEQENNQPEQTDKPGSERILLPVVIVLVVLALLFSITLLFYRSFFPLAFFGSLCVLLILLGILLYRSRKIE
jgi:eukaryotic-like serine/threonine-protein kinase